MAGRPKTSFSTTESMFWRNAATNAYLLQETYVEK